MRVLHLRLLRLLLLLRLRHHRLYVIRTRVVRRSGGSGSNLREGALLMGLWLLLRLLLLLLLLRRLHRLGLGQWLLRL